MAQEWTDGRLDDLSNKVGHGFEQVDHRFERVEGEISALRVETRTEFTELRGEMKAGFARVDERLDSLQHTMVLGFIAMAGTMLTGFVAIATQI
jgi:hypothetical protein